MTAYQEVEIDKLAQAIGLDLSSTLGDVAAELAVELADRAPNDTGRTIESMNVSANRMVGVDPAAGEDRSSTPPNRQSALVKLRTRIRSTARRARIGTKVFYVTVSAPYANSVNSGAAYTKRLKGQPERVRRAAFANMKKRAQARGELPFPPYRPRSSTTGNFQGWFTVNSRDIAKVMAKVSRNSRNRRLRV